MSLLRLVISVLVLMPSLVVAQGTTGNTAFNPAISLILDGKYSSYGSGPPDLTGVMTGSEAGPIVEGLSVGESEFVASANIDDQFYGYLVLAAAVNENETEIEVEEAWIQTLALPGGLSVKAGKFFSDIGYLNSRHPHTWDFVDAPLPYEALLGGNVADSGVQVRWLAPTSLFVEVGGELLRGDAFPAGGAASDGTGGSSFFGRVGGDVGIGHSWRVGLSLLQTESIGRESVLAGTPIAFDGDTDVEIVDFVWKWARNGNPRDRNFTVVAEYLRRSEDGTIASGGTALPYDQTLSGYYVYGTYQFMPRWRVGARIDAYESDAALALLPGIGPVGSDPDRLSVMVDFSNSEFSRLRFQISDIDTGQGSTTGIYLQYIMSMGSHGAHAF